MCKPTITREEFVKSYAKQSRLTIEQLDAMSLVAIRCDCDCESCQGWQMSSTMFNRTIPALEIDPISRARLKQFGFVKQGGNDET